MVISKIVIQSLKDAKNGKPIVKGLDLWKSKTTKDFTVGILEGGMRSGKTSLMFILQHSDGSSSIAEMSAAQFEMLIQVVRGATQRFDDSSK